MSEYKTGDLVVLKSGSMRMEVSHVETASQKARAIIKKHRGYLETIRSGDDDAAYANLSLRIPKDALTRTMDELAALGRVTSREVKVPLTCSTTRLAVAKRSGAVALTSRKLSVQETS